MADKVKALQTLCKLETLIHEQAEEERKAVEYRECVLMAQADEVRNQIVTQGTTEIAWNEIRIENNSKAKEKLAYAYSMYRGWQEIAREHDTVFSVQWVEAVNTAIVPYIEYQDELYFLNEEVERESLGLGLPYITEETFELALKTRLIVKADKKYAALILDMMNNPNVYAKEVKAFMDKKKDGFIPWNQLPECLLQCLDK